MRDVCSTQSRVLQGMLSPCLEGCRPCADKLAKIPDEFMGLAQIIWNVSKKWIEDDDITAKTRRIRLNYLTAVSRENEPQLGIQRIKRVITMNSLEERMHE